MFNNDKRFDIDLKYGQISEQELANALCSSDGSTQIEVKTERSHWERTGNIALEITYKGKKSGVYGTEAKYWFHMLASPEGDIKMMFVFNVNVLKAWINKERANLRIISGGDGSHSKMILLPIKEVYKIAFTTA